MSANPPPVLQQLRELVASPSVSCTSPQFDMSNRGVIDLLASWLEDLGFAVRVLPLKNQPHKANLIATLGGSSPGSDATPGGLVLAGHTDTVPCDPQRWHQDPFLLSEREGRLYGLGATDMKGFFPIAIEAARRLRDQPLRQPLTILATADEESSMDGARELLAQDLPRARLAIVGEPTDLKPIRLHKGMMMEAIQVIGSAGHSSDPALGNNALEAMHEVIGQLLAYRAELQQRYRHPGFAVPVPTINLGCIHGGDNPNRICGECELHIDLRPLPGMPLQELRAGIRARLQPLAERRGVDIHLRALFPGVEAFEQASASPLVQACEELTGMTAGAVGFATEAPFLQALGLDTLILGPGSINQAHQVDEYLALEQIDPAIAVLQGLIGRFCL